MYHFKIFYDIFFWDMVLHHWIVGTHISRQYGGLIKVKNLTLEDKTTTSSPDVGHLLSSNTAPYPRKTKT
jgi:hypothetical protein